MIDYKENFKRYNKICREIEALKLEQNDLVFNCYVCGKDSRCETMKKIGDKFLCKKCDKFRCKKCEILLKNKACRCGDKHGEHTEESLPYCVDCKKEMEEKKKEEN